MTPEETLFKAQEKLRKLVAQREAKQRLLEVTAERKRRQREEAIRYYRPHLKQQEFHLAPNRIRLVLGGNRSGKTQSGCSEDFASAWGERIWFPPDHPGRKVPIRTPNKGLIVGESFGEQIKKVLVPKLLGDPERGIPGVIPKGLIKSTKKNQLGIITWIELVNGSTITFQSYDQEDDLFESTDYDWVHFDEPPPRNIWIAVQRGLTDRMGRAWLTLTPLKEPWIYDELVSNPEVYKVFFDMYDNVGYGLTKEGVDEFVALLTKDEIEARVHGRFFHLTGLVYKGYGEIHRVSRQKTLAEYDGKIPEAWNLWFHVDTHPRTAHRAIWGVLRPNDSLIVCGEMICSDPYNRIRPFLEACLVYEQTVLGYRGHVERRIDPSSQINNPMENGRSMYDEARDIMPGIKPGSKNRDAGILFLQQRLSYDLEKAQYPQIFFFDDLREIDHELRHYVWEDWKGRTGEQKTAKQVPRDKDDHLIEGLHRIVIEAQHYETPGYDHDAEDFGPGPQGEFNAGY